MIFVFGSNLAGRHGRGAAKYAKEIYGAVYGVGQGRTGNAYAIPTKDLDIHPMELADIESHVNRFILYAMTHPELEFMVTRIGCGLAGFRDDQIGPMFMLSPNNCIMPIQWKPYLNGEYRWHNDGQLI